MIIGFCDYIAIARYDCCAKLKLLKIMCSLFHFTEACRCRRHVRL